MMDVYGLAFRVDIRHNDCMIDKQNEAVVLQGVLSQNCMEGKDDKRNHIKRGA